MGIPDNEWADEDAKVALRLREVQVKVTPNLNLIKMESDTLQIPLFLKSLLNIASAGSV